MDSRFQRFYEDHFQSSVRLARLLTGREDIAEDLAQEAFIRVYRYAASGERRIENPTALLRTTTVNLCRSWHRSEKRAEIRMVRAAPTLDELTPRQRELDDSLRRLPYEQRAVIVLRYWLGMSGAQIAETLDCREGTVKSRHSRAVRSLRKELS